MFKAQVLGNIGNDAELKHINGNNYACFSVAHNETVNGEKRTTWVDIRKLDREGKLTPHLRKGGCIFAEGSIRVSAYTTQKGELRAGITVWADRLEFAGATGQAQPQPNQQPMAQYQQPQQQMAQYQQPQQQMAQYQQPQQPMAQYQQQQQQSAQQFQQMVQQPVPQYSHGEPLPQQDNDLPF